jgi:hypothetical protein
MASQKLFCLNLKEEIIMSVFFTPKAREDIKKHFIYIQDNGKRCLVSKKFWNTSKPTDFNSANSVDVSTILGCAPEAEIVIHEDDIAGKGKLEHLVEKCWDKYEPNSVLNECYYGQKNEMDKIMVELEKEMMVNARKLMDVQSSGILKQDYKCGDIIDGMKVQKLDDKE